MQILVANLHQQDCTMVGMLKVLDGLVRLENLTNLVGICSSSNIGSLASLVG